MYAKGFCQRCYQRDYERRNRKRINAQARAHARKNRAAHSAATQRWREKRKANPEDVRRCEVEGCDRLHVALGFCEMHYLRFKYHGAAGPPTSLRTERTGNCAVAGCPRPVYSRGWCDLHYNRVRKTGEPGRLEPMRDGSGHIDKQGYRVITVNGRSEKQHRAVMGERLGRPLLPGETVHHKNGVRHDNRIENLELRSGYHPQGVGIADQVAWAREVLDRYDRPQLSFLLD